MATVYANTGDGWVGRFMQSSWSNARDQIAGTGSSSLSSAYFSGVSAYSQAGRGGGTIWYILRSFFSFYTSGITDSVDDGAVFKVYGFSQSSGDVIAVKATSDIASLGTADFNSIDGWVHNTTDGSGGGSNDSNVTKYSAEITSWSTSGYNDIALNAQARTDMQNDDTLYIALINHDFDLLDIDPNGLAAQKNGLYYQNNTGTSKDPYINYTTTAAAAVTHNATFFGANF